MGKSAHKIQSEVHSRNISSSWVEKNIEECVESLKYVRKSMPNWLNFYSVINKLETGKNKEH